MGIPYASPKHQVAGAKFFMVQFIILCSLQICKLHCREERCVGMNNVHPRRRRDFPRAQGNFEVKGDGQPNSSRPKAVYGHSLIIIPSLRMFQEIPPYSLFPTEHVVLKVLK